MQLSPKKIASFTFYDDFPTIVQFCDPLFSRYVNVILMYAVFTTRARVSSKIFTKNCKIIENVFLQTRIQVS